MTQAEIISRLKQGNQRFVNDQLAYAHQVSKRRELLTSGQSPFAIVLSCADSRVVPELVFDTGLGELFVVRVAGNVANASSIASMEYAVVHFGTSVIIVLGHQSCAAVSAAIAGGDNGKWRDNVTEPIYPAVEAAGANAPLESVVRKNAELTAEAISLQSEIIANAVKGGKVQIVPAFFQLDSGIVKFI